MLDCDLYCNRCLEIGLWGIASKIINNKQNTFYDIVNIILRVISVVGGSVAIFFFIQNNESKN